VVLVIDNYDSFTYNLVQYLLELGEEVIVHRNDEISLDRIREANPQQIVISPGPCTPNEAGISVDCIKEFGSSIPILGVCLGHQSIAQAFGGKIVRANQVMHGKTSSIKHDSRGVFANLEGSFIATRYHSLVVEERSLPDCLEVSAWSNDEGSLKEIMAVRHRELFVEGVQFHPESILSEHGYQILKNFLDLSQSELRDEK
jgi:anthranilate synthase component 2